MIEIEIDILRPSELWQNKVDDTWIQTTVEKVLHHLKPAFHTYEVSIVLADDAFVQTLNLKYRNIDKPTNVLSFPTKDEAIALGDIIFAFETIDREAQEQHKTFKDHFAHLLVHGVLHLLGYDHAKPNAAETMEHLETEILNELGINNPYD